MQWEKHAAEVEQATKWWWLFLVTGILWLIVSLIIFRFDIESVAAVGYLIALVVIFAGINEFMAAGVTQGGWRWVHIVLGVLFIIVGIIALFNPFDSFLALAALFGWALLFMGIFNVVVAFMTKSEHEFWWLQLIAGAALILLAFWSAGGYGIGRRALLVIAFAGAFTLIRGITEIILAFQVRSIHKRLTSGAPAGTRAQPAAGSEGSTAPV